MYLGNASGTNAWFDDLQARVFPVPTKQENHYDPFGQNLEEIEIASSNDSKQQYTDKERINDFGLEWTDFGARYYDSQLGRWHTSDPAEQYLSPYTGLGNNAVNGIDPDGRWFGLDDLAAMAIGGVSNLVSAAISGKITNLEKAAVYFAAGAIGGEVALYTGPGGFVVGGALNVAADAYYGEFKNMSTGNKAFGIGLSFLGGGLNALGAAKMAKVAFPKPHAGLVDVGKLTGTFIAENAIPEGKAANHLFSGAVGKLSDTPVNRSLITEISNGVALGVDKYGKSWFARTLSDGTQIYSYAQNGIIKGAGINQTVVDIVKRYALK